MGFDHSRRRNSIYVYEVLKTKKKSRRVRVLIWMYGHGIHYIFEGERLGVLRKFFSFQLVFPPPPLTICSTVESLPKPFTPLDVSPYSLYHDSLSIPRGQGCLSSSIYVFFLMQCALNVYTM